LGFTWSYQPVDPHGLNAQDQSYTIDMTFILAKTFLQPKNSVFRLLTDQVMPPVYLTELRN